MPLPLQILLWVIVAVLSVILLIAVIIILMLCLRVGLFIKADKKSLSVYMTLGAIKLKVYPLKLPKKKFKPRKYTAERVRRLEERAAERERKRQLKKAKKKKAATSEQKAPAEQKEKKKLSREQLKAAYGSAKEILPQIPPIILDVANLFRFLAAKSFRGLHIDVAKIRILVGTNDVAITAYLYTAIVSVLNPLLMFIKKEAHLHGAKRADIYITPDYLREDTDFEIALGFSIRPIRLISIGLRLIFKMLGVLIKRHQLIIDLVKLIQIFIEDEEQKAGDGADQETVRDSAEEIKEENKNQA